MEIRPMEWTDYQKVYALWLSCPGMGLNDLDDSLEGIGRFLQRNPETCFVAVEGESIAGCILAGTDGRRAYIYHTAVHPEFRRRGIGRQLVERLLAALQKIGIHKAALVAFSRNQPGNAFWEKWDLPSARTLPTATGPLQSCGASTHKRSRPGKKGPVPSLPPNPPRACVSGGIWAAVGNFPLPQPVFSMF